MGFYTEEQWLQWIDALAEQDYVVIDSFFSEDMLSEILDFFVQKRAEDDFEKASIGVQAQVISEIRGDYTFWLDRQRDTALKPFFELITESIEKLNRYCYLSLSDYEFHLAYYPPKTYYKKHLDQFRERSNRMISFIIYLNEDWTPGDGGELKIYKKDGEDIVAPLLNRAVLFKSADVPHEVLLTHKGRASLTGWLLYQPQVLGGILA
ncbi:2OG-Fe(II) oxygenase [Marinilongibacter aquaticus]|uniref:2OG-Fe(II) oxygenase n=1 Tax=Marinilongibacter aquaticus TaxID=2975157 RepID=UPI0021BD70EE|nr:2OG-Fe(II) oxygenase [Marinilongibacter aquaticus]UBM59808.1 2OG-Fe(II) oxygenase [Marinilongibacter aquaticus]